jgi:Zn-dependent protease
MTFDSQWLYNLILLAPGGLLGLTLHEYAHARVALAFGDPTAAALGRTSLNPLVHLDPLGTLAIVLIGFGWAKPVPVDPSRLRPPGLGDIMVSIAGPGANLLLAFAFAGILHLMIFLTPIVHVWPRLWTMLYEMALVAVLVNIALFTFNLIPLFPLDGHHVVREILPWNKRGPFMQWQRRYGRVLLLGVLFAPQLLAMAGHPVFNPISAGMLFMQGHFLQLVGLG